MQRKYMYRFYYPISLFTFYMQSVKKKKSTFLEVTTDNGTKAQFDSIYFRLMNLLLPYRPCVVQRCISFCQH